MIGIFYGNAIKSNFSFLRIWELQNILILLLGVPFLFLQSNVNLPNFMEEGVSNGQRFLKPITPIFGIFSKI